MIDQYIRLHGKRLYGLCLRLCANRIEADDLYQDTWLKAVQNIERYDVNQAFEPWLTKICVNTYRNTLRRIARSPFLNFYSSDEKDNRVQSVPAPEEPDYEPLYKAIDRLPEKMRMTVVLFYFQDMDLKAAARSLGIPEGTVKSRLNKARKLLKEALGRETDLPF